MDITMILQAAVYLIAAVALAVAIPWIKNRVGNEHMDELLRWVEIGVAAAEQIFLSCQGEQKKRFVVAFIESKGYKIDEASLDTAIEAAVNRLHAELYGGGGYAEKSGH